MKGNRKGRDVVNVVCLDQRLALGMVWSGRWSLTSVSRRLLSKFTNVTGCLG
jgi:hypothetical protein